MLQCAIRHHCKKKNNNNILELGVETQCSLHCYTDLDYCFWQLYYYYLYYFLAHCTIVVNLEDTTIESKLKTYSRLIELQPKALKDNIPVMQQRHLVVLF